MTALEVFFFLYLVVSYLKKVLKKGHIKNHYLKQLKTQRRRKRERVSI